MTAAKHCLQTQWRRIEHFFQNSAKQFPALGHTKDCYHLNNPGQSTALIVPKHFCCWDWSANSAFAELATRPLTRDIGKDKPDFMIGTLPVRDFSARQLSRRPAMRSWPRLYNWALRKDVRWWIFPTLTSRRCGLRIPRFAASRNLSITSSRTAYLSLGASISLQGKKSCRTAFKGRN